MPLLTAVGETFVPPTTIIRENSVLLGGGVCLATSTPRGTAKLLAAVANGRTNTLCPLDWVFIYPGFCLCSRGYLSLTATIYNSGIGFELRPLKWPRCILDLEVLEASKPSAGAERFRTSRIELSFHNDRKTESYHWLVACITAREVYQTYQRQLCRNNPFLGVNSPD